jgi:hypothetical protein
MVVAVVSGMLSVKEQASRTPDDRRRLDCDPFGFFASRTIVQTAELSALDGSRITVETVQTASDLSQPHWLVEVPTAGRSACVSHRCNEQELEAKMSLTLLYADEATARQAVEGLRALIPSR